MKYLKLFSLHNLALLNDWLEESENLFVDIYIPHNASDSDKFFVRSMGELKHLIKNQTSNEIEISIYRQKQFLLSGMVDEKFLIKAVSKIKDGEDYVILSLENKFPEAIELLENGDSHEELKKHLTEVSSRKIAIEIDSGKFPWHSRNATEVFQISVRKNQNWYERFVQNPERYEHLEEFWQE